MRNKLHGYNTVCACVLVFALLTQLTSCSKPEKPAPQPAQQSSKNPSAPSAEMIIENNRGVGLMGQFKYPEAVEVFSALHDKYPDDIGVTVNLAIARLNEQGEKSVALATKLLDEAVAKDPRNVRANYCRGLLRLYAGEPNKAIANFTVATEAMPEDAIAAYLYGLCLEQTDKHKEAGAAFERALELDPYLASAVLGLSRVARQTDEMDRAQQYIADFQRLQANPYARVFEFKYKAMGPLGEAWAIGDPAEPSALPEGALFTALEPMQNSDGSGALTVSGGTISFVDLEGDGDIDLVLTGAPGTGSTIPLVNDGQGKFAQPVDHPLLAAENVRSLLHGDIDNNSRVDHVVLGDEAQLLLHGGENGDADPKWKSVTIADAIGDNSKISGAALFDADHDGDLDLYCIRTDKPDVLVNNDRDGSFRALGKDFGLDSGTSKSRQVVMADFDNDRDLDLFIIKEEGGHVILENDRLWQYTTSTAAAELCASAIDYCVSADLNRDGYVDMVTLARPASGGADREASDETVTIWHGMPNREFSKAVTFTVAISEGARPQPAIAVRDLNGDGATEILIASGKEILIYDNEGELGETISAPEPIVAWGLANFDATAGPTLVIATATQLLQAAPGPGRHKFVTVAFGGQHNDGDSLRSNFSGIGTHWRARAGAFATSGVTLPDTSGKSQSLQPTQIGLGGQAQLDTLEIVWPDGVFQSELALSPGEPRQIVETQRQLSSCPVLFAWNGKTYEFVTDLIGVGGMGFLVEPGVYGDPRPFERLLLSTEQLAQRDGRLALKLGEPMEEACYLDQVALQVIDIPAGWSLALDERAGLTEPLPTSELIFFRDASIQHPVASVNDRGMDMQSAIAEADSVAADVGEIDERFIGILKHQHILTVRFEPPLRSRMLKTSGPSQGVAALATDESGKSPPRVPVLLINGWIEYPYSQTNFAAWQAGVTQVAPSIDAKSSDGEWIPVLDQFGFPAGMPRAMSVPLVGLPDGTTELRIRTNLEVYWDQIRVAYPEPCPSEAQVGELPFATASLARVGFAARTTAAQRLPHYDYTRRTATWDTRHQEGYYTRFGEIGELVDARDNALAIFGPGEEVHFEFEAPESQPPPSATRWYVLSVAGWCKDMDLYTKSGETLQPIPAAIEQTTLSTRRDELHRKYNTRYRAGK